MHLEHVGIAVRSAESTLALLDDLLGAKPYKSEIVETEAVRTVFLDAGGPKIELIEPISGDSPIAKHLDRRGEGLHHLAFEVDDIETAFSRLSEVGYRLLNDAPKRGADGKLIFFLHPKDTGGVLIELCQSSPKTLEPAYASVGDRRIAFYDSGQSDRTPLILLHSALGSAELDLRELMQKFESTFRVLAIDFTGHGRSDDFGDAEPSIGLFADDALAVLDHLDINQAHVLGFSMGGAVALQLALDHLDRVDRILAHATTVRWEVDEAQAMADAINPDRISAENASWARQLGEAHGQARWQDLARRMARFITSLPLMPNLNEDLGRVASPVLISHGDSDRYFSLEKALHLWRTLPDADIAVHPGVGHSQLGLDLDVFSRTAVKFFQSARQART